MQWSFSRLEKMEMSTAVRHHATKVLPVSWDYFFRRPNEHNDGWGTTWWSGPTDTQLSGCLTVSHTRVWSLFSTSPDAVQVVFGVLPGAGTPAGPVFFSWCHT